MFRYRTFASIFICALVILIVSPAMAQTQTPAQNQLPPPVDRTGSTEANKKIAAAKAEVTKAQAALTPVYEEMEGWTGTTHGARSWRDLPANAVKYVRRIEELIGAPVALLSTSPQRDDTILMRDPFQD